MGQALGEREVTSNIAADPTLQVIESVEEAISSVLGAIGVRTAGGLYSDLIPQAYLAQIGSMHLNRQCHLLHYV